MCDVCVCAEEPPEDRIRCWGTKLIFGCKVCDRSCVPAVPAYDLPCIMQCGRSPDPAVNRGDQSVPGVLSAQRRHVPGHASAYVNAVRSVSPLRHFHGARLAALQLAELAFVDEPVRPGIAHAAGPDQDIGLGFDDSEGVIAAGGSHTWHRIIKASKGEALLAFPGRRQCWRGVAGKGTLTSMLPCSASREVCIGCRVSKLCDKGYTPHSAVFGIHHGLGYYNSRPKLNGWRR